MTQSANAVTLDSADAVARVIDHTLLKPEASREQIRKLCQEAAEFHFASACVNPCWTSFAAEILRGTNVKVCTVAGFPLGATLTEAKACEALEAIRSGAREIDMVINIGALKSGDDRTVETDIVAVVKTCHSSNAICKVILETALLTDYEKRHACTLAKKASADFVKTSTGFGPGGATVEDVVLMRETVGPKMGVKASGGIRSFEDLKKMLAAGATRIGTSSGVKIIEEARRTFSK